LAADVLGQPNGPIVKGLATSRKMPNCIGNIIYIYIYIYIYICIYIYKINEVTVRNFVNFSTDLTYA